MINDANQTWNYYLNTVDRPSFKGRIDSCSKVFNLAIRDFANKSN